MTEKKEAKISRRRFLTAGSLFGALGLGAAYSLADGTGMLETLQPIEATFVENPLDYYPKRGWEKLYRDQYAYDYKARTICSPMIRRSSGTSSGLPRTVRSRPAKVSRCSVNSVSR